ncbi:response regulator [Puniceicoccaceae bacterium K14]|nr:response regulator [Puniceicoccaceae bacterium K14]
MEKSPQESVMIVDDTQPNLRLICEMLGKKDYRLRPFSNPLTALKSALADPPALFLLDINMPEMDGYELCDALKREESTKNVPVIFISALKEVARIVEGFHHGAVDYVTKPFQFEEVVSRIDTHLELQRYQKALTEKNEKLQETLNTLKRTHSQLIHAEKMASLGILSAGIAHEINNPINFIQANANLLDKRLKQIVQGQREFNEKEICDWQELVEGFVEGSARITEISNSLSIYARVDEDDVKLFDPKTNIEATLHIFKHELKERIKLDTSIEDPQLPLLANPGQINQVTANLISNAISAVQLNSDEQPAEISLTATNTCNDEKNGYTIKVTDNGPGMSPQTLKHLFEPFYTTKPPGQGLGLGLSIAASIMKQHKGSLSGKNAEEGASFEAFLPFSESK